MKINSRKLISAFIFGIVVVLAVQQLWSMLRAREAKAVVREIDSYLGMQRKEILLLANLTKQNGADDVTKGIITDCGSDDRKRFDELLGKLSASISRNETLILKELFYKCGDYYSTTRGVMASSLQREVSVFADYVRLRMQITSASTTLDTEVATWKDIAEAEQKNATNFARLVGIQGSIIETLLVGKTADSPEVKLLIAEANRVQGQMVVISKQIEDQRLRVSGI